MKPVHILAIPGSLRPASSNHAVIRAAMQYLPAHVTMHVYNGLASLPHFNDSKDPGAEVMDLRAQLKAADGVLICSPEYAFGVPGSLKNALDWTVASGEFVGKPLALITAATGGSNAHAALQLIFTALSANLAEDAALLISFVRAKLDDKGDVAHMETLHAIDKTVQSLLRNIATKEAAGDNQY